MTYKAIKHNYGEKQVTNRHSGPTGENFLRACKYLENLVASPEFGVRSTGAEA
jgi:hypothetical protein